MPDCERIGNLELRLFILNQHIDPVREFSELPGAASLSPVNVNVLLMSMAHLDISHTHSQVPNESSQKQNFNKG